MNTDLPLNWVEVPFGELNQFASKTVDPSEFAQETFELYSVPSFPTGKPEIVAGASIGSTKQSVEPYDVLVCKINPRINRVWQVGPLQQNRQIASSEWIGFRCDLLETRFFRHFFSSPDFRELICTDVTGVGGSLTRAQPKKVATFPVPVAPLSEQTRISDKLDTVLRRVDACRDRLDRIPAILKRFRQSVVSAAVSGKLTDEWRSQQSSGENAGRITSTTLADLCQTGKVITYGVIKLGDETPGGVPCLRTSNVRWLRIDPTGMKRIAPSLSAEYSRTILEGAEVLVNVRGTLGGVAVTSADMVGWNVSREVAVVPVDPAKADPDFLALWIASDRQQRWLSKLEKGVAYVGINIEDLRTLPVELPSFSEQREIVRRVESLFAYSDRIEARYAAAHAQVEKLTPSLLAKAFSGELVPQDPSDEPASALIKRIKKSQQLASMVKENPPKKKDSKRMAANTILPVVETLRLAQESLSTKTLFEKANYPTNADAKLIEQFFLDIRQALDSSQIIRVRQGDEDYFSLPQE